MLKYALENSLESPYNDFIGPKEVSLDKIFELFIKLTLYTIFRNLRWRISKLLRINSLMTDTLYSLFKGDLLLWQQIIQ